jgi:hypothetical protein
MSDVGGKSATAMSRTAAVLDPSGQASPAERQPCRTAGARFTAARVLGRGAPGGLPDILARLTDLVHADTSVSSTHRYVVEMPPPISAGAEHR